MSFHFFNFVMMNRAAFMRLTNKKKKKKKKLCDDEVTYAYEDDYGNVA